MDNLGYHYKDSAGIRLNNKLRYVSDAVTAGNYTEDIDGQVADNYSYDQIGNLTHDTKEKIDSIEWNVYGKIAQIWKENSPSVGELQRIAYRYDASGNRISKTVYSNQDATNYKAVHTWYVRDASGNVMATYSSEDVAAKSTLATGTLGKLYLNELHMYGSSRLGIWNRKLDMDVLPGSGGEAPLLGTLGIDTFNRGNKFFELANHLGNVLVTVSDRKVGQNPVSGLYSSYTAEVVSASDYAPFGMQMVGRTFSAGAYRYGFNGKENDNEVKGEGNQQDYGMRIYDPRLGKFLSVDPLTKSYPWYTPYQFAGNKPIVAIDLDGLEEAFRIDYSSVSTALKTFKSSDVRNELHKNIAVLSQTLAKPKEPETWNDWDVWKNISKDKLFAVKERFVHDYRSVINVAAEKYDIPPVLLAGVAFNEFGGDPPSIDDAAYAVRTFTGGNSKTSFGDLSMQLRTAMETLGYKNAPSERAPGIENKVIESLQDNMQAFFIVAKHLSDLKNVDFKGKSASDLSDEDIKVIGARYNRGSGLSLPKIKENLSYGQAILKRKEKLTELIAEPPKKDP